jgi:hypothetical protein
VSEGRDPAADGSMELRSMLLGLSPAELGLTPEQRRVWAVLMEARMDDVTYTLAVVADGSVSLYFSTGGGIIGAGDHDSVRSAGLAFLDTVDGAIELLTPADTVPLPGPGEVRFHALSFTGRFSAAAPQDDLAEGRHPLSELFYAGQDVITQVRLTDESYKGG